MSQNHMQSMHYVDVLTRAHHRALENAETRRFNRYLDENEIEIENMWNELMYICEECDVEISDTNREDIYNEFINMLYDAYLAI